MINSKKDYIPVVDPARKNPDWKTVIMRMSMKNPMLKKGHHKT